MYCSYFRSPFQFMEGSKDDVELESMLTDEGLMLDIIFNASNTNGNGSTGLAMPDPFFTGASYLTGNGNGLLTSSMTSGGSVSFDDPKDMYYKNTLNADFIQPGKILVFHHRHHSTVVLCVVCVAKIDYLE